MTVDEHVRANVWRVLWLRRLYGSLRYTNNEPRYSGHNAVRRKVYTSDGQTFANTETAARAMGVKRAAAIRESIRTQGKSRKGDCRFSYSPFPGVRYAKERAA